MGQLKQIGSSFYDTRVEIQVLKEEEYSGQTYVTMQLFFDNKGE